MAEVARDYTARDFLHPRYWFHWLLVGVLRLITVLPLPLIAMLGALLGELLYLLMAGRRHTTLTNLRLCFPEQTPRQRRRVARAHFRAFAQAALVTPIVWWASAARIRRLVATPGIEHFQHALAAKQPVILLVPHFVAMDIAGMVLAPDYRMMTMYKRPKNRFYDYQLRRSRTRFFFLQHGRLVERREGIKPVIRGLREGLSFYYLPDQDQGRTGSVFAPFFGVPAATVDALPRLARISGAVVIPCIARQLPWGRGYELRFKPPLENFPSDNVLADTTRMNQIIEDAVRDLPEQYFWVHRRFKTRPVGEQSLY